MLRISVRMFRISKFVMGVNQKNFYFFTTRPHTKSETIGAHTKSNYVISKDFKNNHLVTQFFYQQAGGLHEETKIRTPMHMVVTEYSNRT
jgi:hypothetical protein